MDKKKQAQRRVEPGKKKAVERDQAKSDKTAHPQEIPREAFRKNLGCGG